jgi:hypothetical protein
MKWMMACSVLACVFWCGTQLMTWAEEDGAAAAGAVAPAAPAQITLEGKIEVKQNDKGAKPTFLVTTSPKQHLWLSNDGVQKSSGFDFTPYAGKMVRLVAQGSDKDGKIKIGKIISVDVLEEPAPTTP